LVEISEVVVAGGDTPAGRPHPALVEVVVVDDQARWRATLADVVGETPGLTVVGEAGSGEESLEVVERLAPRLVVMDVRMPGIGGIEATRRLTATHPGLVVVLASVDGRDAEGLRTCGAATFLRKEQLSPRALRAAWQAHGEHGG
jgi:two-component system, NarL family, invasion response regulator UvrY